MQEIRRREKTESKKVSFTISSTAGKPIKQIDVSVVFLLLLVILTTSCVSLLGFSLFDYYHLRKSIAGIGRITQKVVDQRDEITHQRVQIQNFANEINTLKGNLVRLKQFEQKLRVIANLEPAEEQTVPFGVGGATPEDLDAQLELSTGHENLMREMHARINDLESASLHQSDRFDALLNKLDDQRSLLASTPAIKPSSGWTTSRFGYRTSPFTGHREFHRGVDIANHKGTAVMASADGVVSFVGKKHNMGNVVVIDHGHGLTTRYAHLDEALTKRGAKVKRGDIIAQMGNTGRSTGPHLHYEVHLNGVAVNPEKYILD